jgi:murein DD-endopeptidase MepM/ murein hydrolase activator NlpD
MADPSRFASELFEHRNRVIAELREHGFDWMTHYSSVEVLQDTYGIEVCGIRGDDGAIEILGILRRIFPSWTEGWTYCKGFGRDQGFVALIQRDPEPPRDHWEPGELPLSKFADDHVYGLPYGEGRAFRVIQGYGGPFTHRGRSSYCLDFGMPTNTPVSAARSGVVVEVIDEYAEGGNDWAYRSKTNRVVISHEDGTSAYYGHLNENGVAVHLDQHVSAGEVVGYSGNTGMSGGPHLHFHVSWLGEPVPTKFTTVEGVAIYLEEGKRYTTPYGPDRPWLARLQRLRAKFTHILG